jgi:hypothetical protein
MANEPLHRSQRATGRNDLLGHAGDSVRRLLSAGDFEPNKAGSFLRRTQPCTPVDCLS